MDDDLRQLALAHPDSMAELTVMAGTDPENVELRLHPWLPRGRVFVIDRERDQRDLQEELRKPITLPDPPSRPPDRGYYPVLPVRPSDAIRITGV